MKHSKKRSLGGFFALVCALLLFVMPMDHAKATEGGISWRTEGDTLYIEGVGAMTDVAEGGQAPWYSHKEHVTKIVIGEGITSIGARSFSDFSRVREAVISTTVMGVGDYAFRGCTALEAAPLPKAVTALGDGAFLSCIALQSIEIPEGCGHIGAYAFAHCEKLSRAVLPTAVSYLGDYAFFGAASLQAVQLPATLTAVPNACFRDCISLVSVVLPSGMERIGNYAFYGCASLTECLLPAKVQDVGSYAFYKTGLQRADLPDGVTVVGEYAFSSCEKLTTVTLPGRLRELPKGVFAGDKKLTGVTLPEALESIGDEAFSYCLALEEIVVPVNVRHIGTNAFAYASALVQVDFQAVSCFVAGTAALPVFQGCTALSVFDFSDSVTVVPEALCYGLTGLARVEIGSGVREIGSSAFEGCTALAKVQLPDGLQRVGKAAFYRCPALLSLHVPASLRTAGYYAFYAGDSCRIFTELSRAESGFDGAWNGAAAVLWQGQWVSCSFYARGKLLDTQYLVLGESCTPPFVENDTPHVGYTAYFNGWDINGDGTADSLPLQVTTSFRAEALYRELPNRYTCRFYDHHGALVAEIPLYYGDVITAPAAPERPSDGVYTYIFTGWDGFAQGMTVTGDLSFTATYRQEAIDKQAPLFSQMGNGDAYYVPFGLTVTDNKGVTRLWLDGRELSCSGDTQVTFTLPADGGRHIVIAEDAAGNRSEIALQSKLVSQVLGELPETALGVYGAETLVKETLAAVDKVLAAQLAEQDRGLLTDYRAALLEAYRRSLAAVAITVDKTAPFFLQDPVTDAALLTAEDALCWLEGGQVRYVLEATLPAEDVQEELRLQAGSRDKQVICMYSVTLWRREITAEGAEREQVSNTGKCHMTIDQAWAEKKGAALMLLAGEDVQLITLQGEMDIPLQAGGISLAVVKNENANTGMLALALGVALFTALLVGGGVLWLVKLRARRVVRKADADHASVTSALQEEQEVTPDSAAEEKPAVDDDAGTEDAEEEPCDSVEEGPSSNEEEVTEIDLQDMEYDDLDDE